MDETTNEVKNAPIATVTRVPPDELENKDAVIKTEAENKPTPIVTSTRTP